MDSKRVDGRRIGILLLLQMASALILPFVLYGALAKGYPSFMDTVVENAAYVRAGVLVSFFGAGLTLALGTFMLPVLRRHSPAAAILFPCTLRRKLHARRGTERRCTVYAFRWSEICERQPASGIVSRA